MKDKEYTDEDIENMLDSICDCDVENELEYEDIKGPFAEYINKENALCDHITRSYHEGEGFIWNEIPYADGMENGICKYYYSPEEIKNYYEAKGITINDDDECRFFGILRRIGKAVNDKESGFWITFSKEGNKILSIHDFGFENEKLLNKNVCYAFNVDNGVLMFIEERYKKVWSYTKAKEKEE